MLHVGDTAREDWTGARAAGLHAVRALEACAKIRRLRCKAVSELPNRDRAVPHGRQDFVGLGFGEPVLGPFLFDGGRTFRLLRAASRGEAAQSDERQQDDDGRFREHRQPGSIYRTRGNGAKVQIEARSPRTS